MKISLQIGRTATVALLALLALCACSKPSAAPVIASPTAEQRSSATEPATSPATSCVLSTVVALKPRGDVYELSARLRNVSDHAVAFEITDHCPLGAAQFSGLPGDYDYYRGCTKGACAEPTRQLKFSLAAGEGVEIENVEIDPVGAQCTAALPKGSYSINFTVEATVKVCDGGAVKLAYFPYD